MKLHKQRKQVEAMKMLQKNYKAKSGPPLWYCPLCAAVNNNARSFSCSRCVWVVETGSDCGEAMAEYWAKYAPGEEEPSHGMIRNASYHRYGPVFESWRKKRLRELNRWIKKYEA